MAGDLLWYPVRGDNKTRRAPDVLVALQRPKGHRGSYRQWVEEGHPPDVVFEVLSPRNTPHEMQEKLAFYSRFGAKEFYVVDPDAHELQVWIDEGDGLQPVERGASFRSPRLGITFRVNGDITVFHADGTPFESFSEVVAERDAAVAERDSVRAERDALLAERDALADRPRILVSATLGCVRPICATPDSTGRPSQAQTCGAPHCSGLRWSEQTYAQRPCANAT